MADPCIALEVALQDCIEQRDADLISNRNGYLLRVTGLDLLTDFFEQDEREKLISLLLLFVWGRGTWETIKSIAKLIQRVLGRIADDPAIPEKVKQTLLRRVGKVLGRILGFLGLAILAYEIVDGWFEWEAADEKTRRAFDQEIADLYRESECPDRDVIFIRLGLPIPSR